MARKTDDWIDENDTEVVVPSRKPKPDRDLVEDFDLDEKDEWDREKGARGRKPADKKHRRPKPEFDDEF